MLLIGLTGSIATGKSTASRLLSSPPHNLPIIDADAIARAVVLPGTPAHARIVAHFAPTTPDLLNPDGTLNRPALGRRVFASGKDRAVLNGITHPAVRWEMYKQILHHYVRGHWAVVLDVPLLFEAHLDVLCGAVLVVGITSREVQLQRLLARDRAAGGSMTREEAEQRVAAQMPLQEKVALCERVYGRRGEVVWNDGGVEALEGELARVVGGWSARRTGWWRLLWGFPLVAGGGAVLVVLGNLWRRRRGEEEGGEGEGEVVGVFVFVSSSSIKKPPPFFSTNPFSLYPVF